MVTSSNSDFHLKIKESLLILRTQPILNKSEASLALYLFEYLHKHFTVLYDYLVIIIIYALLFTFCCFQ